MATLLLADDSVTIQRVIELTFADEDVRVISVSDGESAIARIDAERPDIVLADVGMANVDGYQVAAHVKGTPALAHVPVLLLTGAFEPIDEERARRAGCDGVLVKPFEPQQLIQAVREVLAGGRSAGLWPTDVPRVEPREAPPSPTSVSLPPVTLPPLHLVPALAEAESELELARSLSGHELAGLPETLGMDTAGEFELDRPPRRAETGEAPTVTPQSSTTSLATVFSALLAAERGAPLGRVARIVAPALSEAAVEEIVERVVRRMTDELIRKAVLETTERLIRDEMVRTTSQADTL